MSRQAVTFADFTGGEFGLLGERLAPADTFTGLNVIRLLDGSIAPRSGLVRIAPTGLPAAATMHGFGYNAAGAKLWWISGTAAYQVPLTSLTPATVTLAGALASAPTKRIRSLADHGRLTHVTSFGDKTYTLDHSAATVTALAGSPGGRVIALYNDRLVVASTSSSGQRVQWSAPFTTALWPVANSVDVGWGDADINVLAAHVGRLTIGRTDGTWWVLQGSLGSTHRWQRLMTGLRAGDADNGVSRYGLTAGETLAFAPDFGEYPAFLGKGLIHLDHLSLTNNGEAYADSGQLPKVGVTGLTKPEDVFLATGVSVAAHDKQGLLFHRGTWTKHAFGVTTSGLVDGRLDPQQRLFFTDGATVPKFYAWSYDLNRPPFSGQTWESLGDDSGVAPTCEFTLPAFWPKETGETRVAAVIVEFKKWNHGFGGNNTFTVTVTPLRRDGGEGSTSSGTFTEAASSSSTAGTQASSTFTFDSIFSEGLRIKIGAMVGVAIQRIYLVLDNRPHEAGSDE